MTTATPVLRAAPLTRTVLDVAVEETVGGAPPLARPWPAAVSEPPVLWADDDRLLFCSDGAAVHVTPDRVRLHAPDPETRTATDWLLYATATRALLCLRGRFNLHATLVVDPTGRAVAILGNATAGKSTTTLELVRRGWVLACDDIVEVVPTDRGAVAHPVDRPIHLSDQAAALLGGDTGLGRPLPGTDKRAYRIDTDLTPRRLAAVVVLAKDEAVDRVEAQQVDRLAALPTIAANADRYRVCRLPRHRAAFHAWSTAVCRDCVVWSVRRPPLGDTVASVADAVAAVAASVPSPH